MNNKEIVTKLRDISIQLLNIKDNLKNENEKELTMESFNNLNRLIVKLNK